MKNAKKIQVPPAPAPVPAVAPVGWAVPAQVGSALGAEKTSWGLTND